MRRNLPTKLRRRSATFSKNVVISPEEASFIHSFCSDVRKFADYVSGISSGGFGESILPWLEQNIVYPQSDRSERFDRNLNPVWNWVYEQFATGDWRVISIVAPVGGGKSTFLESVLAYIIACAPGSTLLVSQTDPDALIFAESRLMPMLKKIEPVAALMPTARTLAKKQSVQMGHMRFDLGGANLSTLQSTSRRYVLGDEVWLWGESLGAEALGRTHDRPNSVCVFVGQGGVKDDEHYRIHQTCEQYVFGWICPDCGVWHEYNSLPGQLVFDDIRDLANVRILREVIKTVKLRCESCDLRIEDIEGNRRMLARSGQFRCMQPNSGAWPARLGINFHALAVPWIPWSNLALQILSAHDGKSVGDYSGVRIYKQKRAAQFWNADQDIEVPRFNVTAGDYTEATYVNGEQIENEVVRALTVDVQRGHFWAVLRAYQADGGSRLLTAAKIETWDDITRVAKQYKIKSPAVMLDANYDPIQVQTFCAKHGFTALIGSKINSWVHIDKRGNRTSKMYSVPQRVNVGGLAPAYVIYFSSLHAKDILAVLRQGRATMFEVPRDVMPEYSEHMSAEKRKETQGRPGSLPQPVWVPIGERQNHLFDCEVMQIVFATMLGIIRMDEYFKLMVEPAEKPLEEVKTE
jgi:phage terminase large subunit GpA